jgi:hypothetical protein
MVESEDEMTSSLAEAIQYDQDLENTPTWEQRVVMLEVSVLSFYS